MVICDFDSVACWENLRLCFLIRLDYLRENLGGLVVSLCSYIVRCSVIFLGSSTNNEEVKVYLVVQTYIVVPISADC